MKVLGVVALRGGDRPGGPGRHARDPDLDVPGGRPRLHRPGVLRPDGRPLRAHGPRLARRPAEAGPDTSRLRRAALILLALVYGQIVLGAWLRHYGTLDALAVHAPGRAAVWLHAAHSCSPGGSSGQGRDVPSLVPSARVLAALADAPGRARDHRPRVLASLRRHPAPGRLLRGGGPHRAPDQAAPAPGLECRARPPRLRHLRAGAADDVADHPRTTASGKGSAPANLEVVA